MPAVTSDGVRISYDVVGKGRPLVLLHGWCGDRSWWTEPGYVDELRGDYRLVSIDLRGHGASDKPHEAAAYRMDALTADVFAVAAAEAMIPSGQSLRLPGLGHGGACAASALTVPTARAFLDRWFA